MGIRRVFILMLSFLLFTLPAGYVYADEVGDSKDMEEIREELERLSDGDYSDMTSEEFGRLADQYVQLLIKSKQDSGEEIATEYIVNPPLFIQHEAGLFSFRLPNGQIFFASVPNGMITTEAVKMIPLDSFLVTIRRDGKTISRSAADVYSEPGSYQITMMGFANAETVSEDFNIYGVEFYFRILAPCSNDISYIYPPQSYAIKYIGCEGESLDVQKEGCFLNRDGQYEVSFVSETYPEKSFNFKFQRDTEAPEVIFDQIAIHGKVVSPIHYKVSEPLRKLNVIFNGKELSSTADLLEQEGVYRMIALDMAGNQSETTVEVVKSYPFLGSLWIIIIVILIFAGIGFALFRRRVQMKIL